MKPLTPIGSPSPLRLLNKGPDYLRRQMDGGGRGRSVSAVERLEADKAKYVKSQQVINTKQEPVLVPCATPPPPPRRPLTVPGRSASPSTLGSSPRRPPVAPYSPSLRRVGPRDLDENENEENENDARKENRRVAGMDVDERNRSNANRARLTPTKTITTPGTPAVPLVAPNSAPVLRRSTGKRMMRPDSLVIYRQKKECKTPSVGEVDGNGGTNGDMRGYSFVRRLFQGSMREKSGGGVDGGSPKIVIREAKTLSRDGDSRMSWTNESGQESRRVESHRMAIPSGRTCIGERTQNKAYWNANGNVNGNGNGNANGNVSQDYGDPWEPVVPRRGSESGVGSLRRSKSDLRLRGSLALSEQERFFDFCGLDLDLVERLGPQNFLSGASSVDTLSLALRSVSGGCGGGGGGGGSEASEFSRHSGEGLFQEELTEQLPSGVSIIERNARVIKWLYSCKNAVQEGPKESTV